MDQSPLLARRHFRALLPDSRAPTHKSGAHTEPDTSWQVALAPPPCGEEGGGIPRPEVRDALLRLVSDEETVHLMESFWRLIRLEGIAARAELFDQAVLDVRGSGDEKALAENWIIFCEHRFTGRNTPLKTRAQIRTHLRNIAMYKPTVKFAHLTFSMIGGLCVCVCVRE